MWYCINVTCLTPSLMVPLMLPGRHRASSPAAAPQRSPKIASPRGPPPSWLCSGPSHNIRFWCAPLMSPVIVPLFYPPLRSLFSSAAVTLGNRGSRLMEVLLCLPLCGYDITHTNSSLALRMRNNIWRQWDVFTRINRSLSSLATGGVSL